MSDMTGPIVGLGEPPEPTITKAMIDAQYPSHDPRCRGKDHEVGIGCCDCAFIDLIRYEQNEKIARAIEAVSPLARHSDARWMRERAAHIARNGGVDPRD